MAPPGSARGGGSSAASRCHTATHWRATGAGGPGKRVERASRKAARGRWRGQRRQQMLLDPTAECRFGVGGGTKNLTSSAQYYPPAQLFQAPCLTARLPAGLHTPPAWPPSPHAAPTSVLGEVAGPARRLRQQLGRHQRPHLRCRLLGAQQLHLGVRLQAERNRGRKQSHGRPGGGAAAVLCAGTSIWR